MAAVTEVDTHFVRKIYGDENVTDWNDKRRKAFRDDQLDGNADVLFKVYRPVDPLATEQKLHCLLLRPTRDPIWWMMFIRRHYVLTVQWTHRVDEDEDEEEGKKTKNKKKHKKTKKQVIHRLADGVTHSIDVRDVLNISGNREQLIIFCREFPDHLQEINNHDENISVDAHIEDLNERIQELQLQNTILQQLQN